MKIDFSQVLRGLNGDPVREPGKDEGDLVDVTLKTMTYRALTSQSEDQKNMKPEEKYKRGKLAEKVFASEGLLELKIEEVAQIKEQIGKIFPIIIVAPAWDMLEDKGEEDGNG